MARPVSKMNKIKQGSLDKENPLSIQDYPCFIHSLECQVAEHNQQIISLKRTIVELENEADRKVNADESLKNEAQRRVKRLDILKADPLYCEAVDQFVAAEQEKDKAQAHLRRAVSEFQILKLEMQLEIAKLKAGATDE